MNPVRVLLASFLATTLASLGAETTRFEAEVLSESALLTPVKRGIHRFATCPDGRTVLTSFDGGFTVVNAEGVTLEDGSVPEMEEVSAITCPGNDRLYAAAKGEIRIFSFGDDEEISLERSFWIGGLPVRLLATPNGNLYVLGMARLDGNPVFLRIYRIADGVLLDAPNIGVPFQLGSTFNNLLINGDLLWHADRQEVVYFPANPARAWSFDQEGGPRTVGAPIPLGAFQAADVSGITGGRPDWRAYDSIRNATALPDGRIVLQIFPGRPATPQPIEDPGKLIRLVILDQDFRILADGIEQGFMGLLSGADADGNLYFADLVINRAGKLRKASLRAMN